MGLIYAVHLHLKHMRKWRGERLAWFAIIAMPICDRARLISSGLLSRSRFVVAAAAPSVESL